MIVVANGCVYRENVLNEKCFFSLQLREAKNARRNSTCLRGLLRTFNAKLLRGDPSKGPKKFKTFCNTFGHSLIFDVRKKKEEKMG